MAWDEFVSFAGILQVDAVQYSNLKALLFEIPVAVFSKDVVRSYIPQMTLDEAFEKKAALNRISCKCQSRSKPARCVRWEGCRRV